MGTSTALPTATESVPAAPTINRLIGLGALGGVLAGVASSAVLLALGESSISEAIDIESQRPHVGEAHEEMFSRTTQVIGGTVGLVLVGALLGIVFAVIFARTRHRLPGAHDFVRARWLALAGFMAVIVVPALKYPANPPAVGDPETVNARTLGYVAIIGLSVIAIAVAVRLAPSVRQKVPPALVALAVALPALALLTVALLVLPDAAPADIPAELLWRFRLASFAGQAAMWSTLALAFGALVDRPART